jgi:hypothetical protein
MTVRDIRGMSDDFVVFEVGISSKAKKSSKRTPPLLLPFLIYSILLCLVELFLSLLASRTFPVIRQIFQCKAVMLGRIIHIAADRTDILACPFLCYKIVLRGPDGRRRIIEIHHPLYFQVFISQRRMGAAVNGRMVADEFPDGILRAPGQMDIIKWIVDDNLSQEKAEELLAQVLLQPPAKRPMIN